MRRAPAIAQEEPTNNTSEEFHRRFQVGVWLDISTVTELIDRPTPKPAQPQPGQTFPSRVNPVADPEKQKRDNNMFRSLCAAYRAKDQKLPTDKIPQLATLCESPEMQ